MMVIKSVQQMQEYALSARAQGKIIGFVPTMGYLHEGHLSLMRIARPKCDILVVSIFVNPKQFCAGEDLERYPRDLQRDIRLCGQENVDVVFAPSDDEIYPDGYSTYVDVSGKMTEVLCGAFRKGHFRGVTTIVTKLFNIVQPHFAVFGQKDGQQLAVIKKMVSDLNIPVEIISAPTVREKDGLAMSSRNEYLNAEERSVAPAIYNSLLLAQKMIIAGVRDANAIISSMREMLEGFAIFRIQYIEIVDAETLEPVQKIEGKIMIALAVFLGKTRLIDNITMQV